jgi:putative FmdB family regulatory protein
MPFYEYECPSCRYYLEVLQKISDKPVKKCPSCGKAGFKRLMSAPVFRLKGSGWYETDFKSDKEGQRNLAGAEPAEPAEPKAAVPEAKASGDDKAAKPEAASASGDTAKAESSAPAGRSKKSSKSSAATTRSASAKRAVKRPAARATRKPARTAKRGSRRR